MNELTKIQAKMLEMADEKLFSLGGLPALRTIQDPLKSALSDARSAMLGIVPDDNECQRIIDILEAN